MRLDPAWLRVHVVRPALQRIELWSDAAEVLVTGTALVESNATWLRQFNSGPALGLWQIEPATARSLWLDLLRYRPALARRVLGLVDRVIPIEPDWAALAVQLKPHLVAYGGASSVPELFWYSAAMARVRYLWDPLPLPKADDATELARCWKRSYNTRFGAGSVAKAVPYFEEAISCHPLE